MAVDPDALACLVFTADLVAPPPPGRWAAVGRFAGALAKLVADVAEPTDGVARHDLLVTRRDTRAPVLRIDADTADVELLQHVRLQLEQLTVAEFVDHWAIDPTTLT
jgi:hypothetical protein